MVFINELSTNEFKLICFCNRFASIICLIMVFNLRRAKLDFLRPFVDEVNLLEEQQREWEAKISQVSLIDPERKK